MHMPDHFAVSNVESLHHIIHSFPLATLVASTSAGPLVDHVPLHFLKQHGSSGLLCGHIARGNPLCTNGDLHHEALIIFHGPNAYISPHWYLSKAQNGMVVPTWNYVVVHVRGRLKLIEDPAWLHNHFELLVTQLEAGFDSPWRVQDVPHGFIDILSKAVIGIEIEITKLQGKWKCSQNQSAENQWGVVQGLRQQNTAGSLEMAMLMEAMYSSQAM